MKYRNFPIVIEQSDDGFFASCLELQGCYTQGDTYEEAIANIKDAIQLHMKDRRAAREKIVVPRSISVSLVEVPA